MKIKEKKHDGCHLVKRRLLVFASDSDSERLIKPLSDRSIIERKIDPFSVKPEELKHSKPNSLSYFHSRTVASQITRRRNRNNKHHLNNANVSWLTFDVAVPVIGRSVSL